MGEKISTDFFLNKHYDSRLQDCSLSFQMFIHASRCMVGLRKVEYRLMERGRDSCVCYVSDVIIMQWCDVFYLKMFRPIK